jgi:uncharacterized membrane protein YbhN (UPF0104 family)
VTDSRRRLVRLAVATLCMVLLVVAARSLDIARALSEVRAAHLWWLVGATVSYLLILPLWAEQWRLLAPHGPRGSRREMFAVVAMTASAHNTMFAMAGETATVLLLVTRIGLERAAAIAVLLLDQLLVGLAKIVLLATAALVLSSSVPVANGSLVDVRASSRGALVLVASVAVLLVALVRLAHRDAANERTAAWIPARLRPHVEDVARALAPLRDRRALFAFLLALAKKGCELVAIVLVQRAFGVELPFGSAVLILAALNLATIIPVVPGNAGVYEAAVVWTYVRLGVPLERATGMAVAQHACYLTALALPGYRWLAGSDPSRSASAAA